MKKCSPLFTLLQQTGLATVLGIGFLGYLPSAQAFDNRNPDAQPSVELNLDALDAVNNQQPATGTTTPVIPSTAPIDSSGSPKLIWQKGPEGQILPGSEKTSVKAKKPKAAKKPAKPAEKAETPKATAKPVAPVKPKAEVTPVEKPIAPVKPSVEVKKPEPVKAPEMPKPEMPKAEPKPVAPAKPAAATSPVPPVNISSAAHEAPPPAMALPTLPLPPKAAAVEAPEEKPLVNPPSLNVPAADMPLPKPVGLPPIPENKSLSADGETEQPIVSWVPKKTPAVTPAPAPAFPVVPADKKTDADTLSPSGALIAAPAVTSVMHNEPPAKPVDLIELQPTPTPAPVTAPSPAAPSALPKLDALKKPLAPSAPATSESAPLIQPSPAPAVTPPAPIPPAAKPPAPLPMPPKPEADVTSPVSAPVTAPATHAALPAPTPAPAPEVTKPAVLDQPAPKAPDDKKSVSLGNTPAGTPTLRVVFKATETSVPLTMTSELDKIAKNLKDNDALRVTLTAYASGVGEQASTARRISLSRALAVRAYLIDQGINNLRINVQAEGDKNPGGESDRVDVFTQDTSEKSNP